jgi:hypothetical protein
MEIDEIIEKLKEHKRENSNKEFDEAYEKYQKEVEKWSGGLVQTNKGDFLKQYAFYTTVVNPVIEEYWNAYLGKGKYSK